MKNLLVVPAAGKSSRFKTNKPKWLLTHPDGNLMIFHALKSFQKSNVDVLIITREDIFKNFKVKELLDNALSGLKININIVTVHETEHAVETVLFGLEKFSSIKNYNKIIIKDSDNYIDGMPCIDEINENFSVGLDLRQFNIKNVANKSFMRISEQGYIEDFVEKSIISNHISLGCHSFVNIEMFISLCHELIERTKYNSKIELYFSNVVALAISRGFKFKYLSASEYCDYGTHSDWNELRNKNRVIFSDFDGTLVKNVGKFTVDRNWSSKNDILIIDNIAKLKKLCDEGAQLIITTSRDEIYKDYIKGLLHLQGIFVYDIICGLKHSPRYLINDYADSNPYPTSIAINLKRDSNDLDDFIS
jgi:bifunctional N-acetylglucosamine-1-phosphate-uridyltransferase/glucosamine-1-phosphate-acetyltransferase GlmU-like protein